MFVLKRSREESFDHTGPMRFVILLERLLCAKNIFGVLRNPFERYVMFILYIVCSRVFNRE